MTEPANVLRTKVTWIVVRDGLWNGSSEIRI